MPTYAPADTFQDCHAQTGLDTRTVEVAGGVMVYMTLPHPVHGHELIRIQTDNPKPAHRVGWWINQATRELYKQARAAQGISSPNHITYIEEKAA